MLESSVSPKQSLIQSYCGDSSVMTPQHQDQNQSYMNMTSQHKSFDKEFCEHSERSSSLKATKHTGKIQETVKYYFNGTDEWNEGRDVVSPLPEAKLISSSTYMTPSSN